MKFAGKRSKRIHIYQETIILTIIVRFISTTPFVPIACRHSTALHHHPPAAVIERRFQAGGNLLLMDTVNL